MWSNIILTQTKKNDEDGETSSEGVVHPPSRYKHCGVLVPTSPGNSNYDLYIFGGRSGPFPFKDFWKLDLKCGRWEEVCTSNKECGDPPPYLQEHSMVYYQGSIYVFGGEINLSYGGDSSPLWIYSVADGRWRRWAMSTGSKDSLPESHRKGWIKSPEMARHAMTKTPVGRRGHTAVVWNNYMLIYGGYRDLKGSLGDLWAFHFDTESWHLFSSHDIHKKQNSRPWYLFSGNGFQSTFPCPRHSHVSVLHNNNLYIHGGMQDLQELQDLWKFDMKLRQWSQIKSKYGPGPLHGHIGVVALESLLILAGERAGKPVDEFWRYDFYGDVWERIILNGCRPCSRVWAWASILPMVYKRVQGNPTNSRYYYQPSPSSTDVEENKYWWDYDESLVAHPEEDDNGPASITSTNSATNGNTSNGGTNSDEKRRGPSLGVGLFSDFTKFAYHNNGDYQALSESNSVCLSEEEASPKPPFNNGRGKHVDPLDRLVTECQSNRQASLAGTSKRLELPTLKMIKEQETLAPLATASLIDLDDDAGVHSSNTATDTNITSTPSSGNSPESPQDLVEPLSLIDDAPSSASQSKPPQPHSSTRRSESATCLQLNLKKSSVKKSASVRFADVEPPTTSSSSNLILARECTSDYSSMEHGLNTNGRLLLGCGGATGFENPNYHGSGSSNLFNHHHHPSSSRPMEAYEMGAMGGEAVVVSEASTSVATSSGSNKAPPKDGAYHYQVTTPNYMLLIGGNECDSRQIVNRRQPLNMWRLRVTRELFVTSQQSLNNNGTGGGYPSSTASQQNQSFRSLSLGSGGGGGSGGGSRPGSGSIKKVMLNTTGF